MQRIQPMPKRLKLEHTPEEKGERQSKDKEIQARHTEGVPGNNRVNPRSIIKVRKYFIFVGKI
ncbi:hypothetical protein NRM5_003220 [Chlamydia psittaci]|nr:hypothetical protein NRM5_003220 [Chlamydia psittaci]